MKLHTRRLSALLVGLGSIASAIYCGILAFTPPSKGALVHGVAAGFLIGSIATVLALFGLFWLWFVVTVEDEDDSAHPGRTPGAS